LKTGAVITVLCLALLAAAPAGASTSGPPSPVSDPSAFAGEQAPGGVNVVSLRDEARRGNPEAQHLLGRLYYWGTGVEKDYAQSLLWWSKAAASGYVPAETSLGLLYKNGYGTPKNPAQAEKWLNKAANDFDVRAETVLAYMYYKGDDVKQDYKRAFELYILAGDRGYAPAQLSLGAIYDKMLDFPNAIKWLTKAADQGDAHAESILASHYVTGIGVEKDEKKAAALYRKAAEQGNKAAQNSLAAMYREGKGGLKQDYAEAYFWMILGQRTDGGFLAATEAVNRTIAGTHLTPAEKSEAEKRAADWKRLHPKAQN
jgi:TPR repeat protein